MNITGCVKCVIPYAFTQSTRCVKSRCVIYPLTGGIYLHILHFDTRRDSLNDLHTTHLHTYTVHGTKWYALREIPIAVMAHVITLGIIYLVDTPVRNLLPT